MNHENIFTDLPKDWIVTTFGEVMDIQGGSQPPKNTFKSEIEDGYIQLLQIRDFGKKPVPTYVPKHLVTKFCEKDDIFIARYGASLGRILTGMEGAYNVALAKVIYDRELFEKGYLFYLLKTPIFQTPIKMISRSAQNGFNKGDLYPINIPVAPYEQQKRIVARIEELFSHIDAGIAALKKAKQLLKQYRQSVLKAAVTGELTKQWREDNKDKLEPVSQLLERILQERRQKWETQQLELFKAKGKVPKDDGWKGKYKEPLAFDAEFEVPEAWVVCPFEQLILELKNGISKKPSEEQGLAILRISAVRPMVVYKDDVRFLPENFDSKDFEIEDGDLLFTRYNGNPEFVGVCGKVKDLKDKTVYPDKLMRARPVSTKKLCTDYLELSLNCGISKNFIRSVTKTTAGQSGVAGGDVKKCPTVLPPYDEQVEIANIVSGKIESMKRLDVEIDIHLLKAEKNKQSILASAFSGSLY